MDVIAERLGWDPLALRLLNVLKRGEPLMEGDLPIDCDFAEGLGKAAAQIGWNEPTAAPRRGKGIACTIKAPLAPSVSSAMVRMHADGSATLLTGTVECGQGARTALSQIVAEELALPLDRVRVARSEVGMSPYDQATSASRSTTLMGLAVLRAARDVRDQLLTIGARLLETERPALTLRDERIYDGGQLLNPSLIDYRVPVMSDLPEEYRSILVENGDGPGPYGAKGIGESGLIPTAPAVANAIARAIGVRITDLPMTPERVWRASDRARRRAAPAEGPST